MANVLAVDAFTEPKASYPGAAPYGNFINYYSFNPPNRRLQFIPRDLTSRMLNDRIRHDGEVTVLDIGCNSGVSLLKIIK